MGSSGSPGFGGPALGNVGLGQVMECSSPAPASRAAPTTHSGARACMPDCAEFRIENQPPVNDLPPAPLSTMSGLLLLRRLGQNHQNGMQHEALTLELYPFYKQSSGGMVLPFLRRTVSRVGGGHPNSDRFCRFGSAFYTAGEFRERFKGLGFRV